MKWYILTDTYQPVARFVKGGVNLDIDPLCCSLFRDHDSLLSHITYSRSSLIYNPVLQLKFPDFRFTEFFIERLFLSCGLVWMEYPEAHGSASSAYRLDMYTYLNRCLNLDRLSYMVGAKVTTGRITHEQCSFTGVTFWQIDRESFYADVAVELSLSTDEGPLTWKGYLVCFCGFDEDLFCDIEELTESVDNKNKDLEKLSPYLIPYSTNKRVDQICESILKTYQKKALTEPKARNAAKLAESMGLKIEYHPVYEHDGVRSILFFKAQPLEIGEDRIETGEDGTKTHIIPKGTPAGTVANIAHVAIENVKIVGKMATGKLTVKEGFEKMEQTTVATVAGIATSTKGVAIGAAIGTVFGPVGTAVGGFIGGTIGYMAGSKVGETVVKGVQKIREKAKDVIKTVGRTVANAASSFANGVRNFCSGVISNKRDGLSENSPTAHPILCTTILCH